MVVRRPDGGDLRDLFEFFPDLPRPVRPKSRTRMNSPWRRRTYR
jgi:hypothetical protein